MASKFYYGINRSEMYSSKDDCENKKTFLSYLSRINCFPLYIFSEIINHNLLLIVKMSKIVKYVYPRHFLGTLFRLRNLINRKKGLISLKRVVMSYCTYKLICHNYYELSCLQSLVITIYQKNLSKIPWVIVFRLNF